MASMSALLVATAGGTMTGALFTPPASMSASSGTPSCSSWSLSSFMVHQKEGAARETSGAASECHAAGFIIAVTGFACAPRKPSIRSISSAGRGDDRQPLDERDAGDERGPLHGRGRLPVRDFQGRGRRPLARDGAGPDQ